MTREASRSRRKIRSQIHDSELDVESLEGIRRSAGEDLSRRLRDQECFGAETFVCYMDTEGFRRRVQSDPAGLYSQLVEVRRILLSSMTSVVVSYTTGTKTSHIHEPSVDLLWPMVFSDSWFMSTRSDSAEDLERLCTASALLFVELAKIGLPAKGAISHGQTWWSWHQQTVLGDGITKAYELAESLDVFGIALDPATQHGEATLVTAPLRVPLKSSGSLSRRKRHRELPFVRLVGTIPAELNPQDARVQAAADRRAGLRLAFAELESSYRSVAAPRRRVVQRYVRSRAVLEATIN